MDCIDWTGCRNNSGYGTRSWQGVSTTAHRVAWMQAHGEIPDGLVVMHTCANRLCVNPEHLKLGTQHQNRMEQVTRSANPKQKLSFEDAAFIRWCFAQAPSTFKQGRSANPWAQRVMQEFGLSKGQLYNLVQGKTFKEA